MEPHLSPADVERRWRSTLRMGVKTLANWRCDPEGRGPDYKRFGNKILYPLSSIEHFEDTGEHRSPSGGYPSQIADVPAALSRSIAPLAVGAAPDLERKWTRLAIHHRRRLVESAGRDLLRSLPLAQGAASS